MKWREQMGANQWECRCVCRSLLSLLTTYCSHCVLFLKVIKWVKEWVRRTERMEPNERKWVWLGSFRSFLHSSFSRPHFAPYHPLVQLLLLGRERSERTNINNQNGGWKVEKWPSLWFPRFRWFQRSGALGSVRSFPRFAPYSLSYCIRCVRG